jgi:hypothetical protein
MVFLSMSHENKVVYMRHETIAQQRHELDGLRHDLERVKISASFRSGEVSRLGYENGKRKLDAI